MNVRIGWQLENDIERIDKGRLVLCKLSPTERKLLSTLLRVPDLRKDLCNQTVDKVIEAMKQRNQSNNSAELYRQICLPIEPSIIASEIVEQNDIKCFYHFTDTRNLDSIKQHGLLTSAELCERGITPVARGGDEQSHESDKEDGLDSYIHLCLFNYHPMAHKARAEKRIAETEFLKISTSVLNQYGIVFTPGMANKNGMPRLTLANANENMYLRFAYSKISQNETSIQYGFRETKKYELLIPNEIEAQYIENI